MKAAHNKGKILKQCPDCGWNLGYFKPGESPLAVHRCFVDFGGGKEGLLTLPMVIWQRLADDDFVFNHGKYCLRVEQLDTNAWWWAVYYENQEVGFNEPQGKTETEAKLLSELFFLRHRIICGNQ